MKKINGFWTTNRWKSLLFIIVLAYLWELHIEKRFISIWHYPKVVICGDKNEKDQARACQSSSKSYVE